MRYFTFLISAFILISCAEEKHDFVYGEYEYKAYYKGELDELVPWHSYNGTVFNDTLFLTTVSFKSDYGNKSCASDTAYYYKTVLGLPLSKKYNRLLNHYTSVSSIFYDNGKSIDTCIRSSINNTRKFSVTENYIEVIWCDNGSDDCNPKDAYVTHFIRPKQYQ